MSFSGFPDSAAFYIQMYQQDVLAIEKQLTKTSCPAEKALLARKSSLYRKELREARTKKK